MPPAVSIPAGLELELPRAGDPGEDGISVVSGPWEGAELAPLLSGSLSLNAVAPFSPEGFTRLLMHLLGCPAGVLRSQTAFKRAVIASSSRNQGGAGVQESRRLPGIGPCQQLAEI